MAGFQRYNRESNHASEQDSKPVLQQAVADCPVLCEYCGERTRPKLDLTLLDIPKTGGQFCCAQYQKLCEWLLEQRCPDWTMSYKELNQYRNQEAQRACDDTSDDTETSSSTINYRLSRIGAAQGDWTVLPQKHTEDKVSKATTEEAKVEIHCCKHNQVRFGFQPHQPSAGFQQRRYSSGRKFLTAFPDGSVQVFYPSGSVALVVLVTEANGRVCVVYDDKDDVPEQPIRALFQSDGRATCYHSNGSIWFSLGQSGGQRLDKSGARVQRWSWSRPGCSPTPLRPLFLSLNKNVGVRILGQDQVFVSFLCCGQQARFSVGICCVQDYINRSSVPSIRSEELFLLAARMGVCLAIEGLRHYMRRFSSHKPFTAKLCQRHHLRVIEKLLRASNTAETSASDKAFIHRCLRNYL